MDSSFAQAPCRLAGSPVNQQPREGVQTGEATNAFSNKTPSSAMRSMWGVSTQGRLPYADTMLRPCVSVVMKTIFRRRAHVEGVAEAFPVVSVIYRAIKMAGSDGTAQTRRAGFMSGPRAGFAALSMAIISWIRILDSCNARPPDLFIHGCDHPRKAGSLRGDVRR